MKKMKKPYAALYGYMMSQGYNCQEVAAGIGMSPQTFSNKTHGISNFTSKEIAAIGHLLDIPHDMYFQLFIEPESRKAGFIDEM